MRAIPGARTVCDCSAIFRSFSESGCTSQKVRVRSKGVWATAQKLEYWRVPCPASAGSAGTIVKLICFDMSVSSHYSADHALNLHLGGIEQKRLHGRVGGLEPDAAGFPVELLERDVGAADKRDDHFTVVGRPAILHDDEVAIADLLVDHRIASDAGHVAVLLGDPVLPNGDS